MVVILGREIEYGWIVISFFLIMLGLSILWQSGFLFPAAIMPWDRYPEYTWCNINVGTCVPETIDGIPVVGGWCKHTGTLVTAKCGETGWACLDLYGNPDDYEWIALEEKYDCPSIAVEEPELECDKYDGYYCEEDYKVYRDYYYSDGKCAYKIVSKEHCTYGCSGGSCNPPPVETAPLVVIIKTFEGIIAEIFG